VNPQVRIARTAGDGYWSYLGTDVLHIGAAAPTMNLDSFTMNTPDSEFYRVVRHETGHTLGFPHEHTRQEIVSRIDSAKAIAYFGAPPNNWSAEQTTQQVLTPLDASALNATAQADIHSIMCYWLPASIMKDNIAVDGGTDIDALDAQFASTLYPLAGVPFTLLVHLQNIGDVTVQNNQFAGTRGQSRRLEGFQIDISPPVPGLSCQYMAHLQGIGDVPWVNAGQFVGTRAQSRRLEGFAIQLTGPQAGNYSVSYMAHLQGTGDTGFYSNGQFCGTRGQSRRVEGMLVRIQQLPP
jgi:Clostridial hydrophobic W